MDLRRDNIQQWTEDYRHGRLSRREFLQRIAMFAGGAALSFAAFDVERATAAAAGFQPVVSTGIDSNNNFVLNGKPFLMIQGETLDYTSWHGAGYTVADVDAKLSVATAAGLNVIVGNWFGEDGALWQKHGIYWHGYCFRDLGAGVDCRGAWHSPATLASSCASQVISKYASKPNLIAWMLDGEMELDASVTSDPQGVVNNYVQATKYVQSIDPIKRLCFTTMVAAGPWSLACRPDAQQLSMVETIVVWGPPWTGLMKMWQVLDYLNQQVLSHPGGLGWVPCVSTTVVKELLTYTRSGPWSSFNEGNRLFWLQVAMNCRAFDVLWGANTRDPSVAPNNGDAGLPPGFLNVWNWTWQIVKNIKSLEPVILAPGNWVRVPTTPQFSPWAPGGGVHRPNMDYLFKGVYAAKKTGPDGSTYVISINMNENDTTGSELPVMRAKMNLGRPIRNATRLFGNAWTARRGPSSNVPVSTSGNEIIADFEPMQVHVYKVSEGDG